MTVNGINFWQHVGPLFLPYLNPLLPLSTIVQAELMIAVASWRLARLDIHFPQESRYLFYPCVEAVAFCTHDTEKGNKLSRKVSMGPI